MKHGRQLNLDEIVLIGRTFDEYRRIFALDDKLLAAGAVLDAGAGVSSFCAEACARGCAVTASDRIYAAAPEIIEKKCGKDLETVIRQLPALADLYVWDYFTNIDSLRRCREEACRRFAADFREHGHRRYVPVEYPSSPFKDKQFLLSLVSHFLFLYDDRLGYDFHRETLSELLRVTSGEIRIFPLVNLRGERSPFVETLRADAAFAGCTFTVEKTGYEFMKNCNEMLLLSPPGNDGRGRRIAKTQQHEK